MLAPRIQHQEVRSTFCRKQPSLLLLRLPVPHTEHVSVLPATPAEYLEDAYNLLILLNTDVSLEAYLSK